MTVSYNTLINVGGVVFWTFLGLMLSARVFYRSPCVAVAGHPDRPDVRAARRWPEETMP
jgi:hypothetical protein